MDAPKTILIVDDEPDNRKLLTAFLRADGHRCLEAPDGATALTRAFETPPDLVLLDIMMPVMSGFEVARRLKEDPRTCEVQVVMVTALSQVEDRVRALDAGADDFMTKPLHRPEVRARVRNSLKVKAYHDQQTADRGALEAAVAARTAELSQSVEALRSAHLETVTRLVRAAEHKDEDTGSHVVRIGHYSAIIGAHLGMTSEEVEQLRLAAPMHDVGKIGIPDKILLKPGPLDDAEWEIMRRHPVMGQQILEGSDSPLLQVAETIALTHHERWDGTGYPRGLRGEEIPLVGRIVAIVDVFDALTTERPYKKAFPLSKALDILNEGRRSHFDPEITDAFFEALDEILEVGERYADSDVTCVTPVHAVAV